MYSEHWPIDLPVKLRHGTHLGIAMVDAKKLCTRPIIRVPEQKQNFSEALHRFSVQTPSCSIQRIGFHIRFLVPLQQVPAWPARRAPVARIAVPSTRAHFIDEVANSTPTDVIYRNSLGVSSFSLEFLVEFEHWTLLLGTVEVTSAASSRSEFIVFAGG